VVRYPVGRGTVSGGPWYGIRWAVVRYPVGSSNNDHAAFKKL